MDIHDLLPIGSVVRLQGAKKSIMIYGVKQWNTEQDREYDYIGVIYPEGNIGGTTQLMFNQEDVETVEFRGYETEERKQFLDRLAAYYESGAAN